VDVYTDGACSGNPGPGGWAWIALDGQHGSGADADTTNQRMELNAVLQALKSLDGKVHIYSDSTYVVKAFNDQWYKGWLAKGWKNSQRKPVANRDLWEPLIELYLKRKDEIDFTWVKGHAGNEWNEKADQLAVFARDEFMGRHSGGSSTAGPSNTAVPNGGSSGDRPDPPWSVEQAIVVTGTRDLDEDIRAELAEAMAQLDPDNDIVISGLRLGSELEGAELALQMGVPVGVVLPYADPVAVWAVRDKARFDAAVEAAEWVVTLNGDRSKPRIAVQFRNEWLWGAAVGAIIVGDEALVDATEMAGLGVIVVG